MTEPQLLCLRWNNHQSNLVSVFDQLLQNEAFCDVTLAVDGRTVKCHQMVLAASSPYFQGIFMENTCKHPIVFLKDMKYNHIRSLVEYIYYGEAAVPEDELQGLLKIAESLKIKGLVEIEEDKPKEKEPKKLGVRKDLSSAGYRSPPNIVINNHNLLENGLRPNPLGMTPTKDDDAHELIIDEDDISIHSSDAASVNGNGAAMASGNGQAVTPIEVSPEYPSYNADETPPAPGMIRVVGANGKAEWKRYKQYTKDDILAAIEEVKAGMSALQASRKYGVPSRTLYDKVKKMGILTANMQKQIQQKKGAPTPPASTNSNSNGATANNTSPAPQINFLGLQVPQANLPTVAVNGHDAANSATISGMSTPAIPSSLMMSVMSMMSEKLKAGGLINKNAMPENLSSLLKKPSTGSEGSDSGHSSEEVENGDIVVIKDEKGGGLGHDDIAEEDPAAADKPPAPNAAASSTAQQILNHLVSLNSLAALNNSTTSTSTSAANVTLMPRGSTAASDLPSVQKSPVLGSRPSSVITSTGSTLKRKRSSSASESSLESQKDMTEVKKLLVEPKRQEAA